MITALEIAAVIFITLLVGSLFYYGFSRRGPWGSFWSFILIIFLSVLLVDIYTEPVGPLYYGIAWFDLIVIGLFFALLLAASGRRYTRRPGLTSDTEEEKRDAVAIGIFFWGLLVFFFLAFFIRIFVGA